VADSLGSAVLTVSVDDTQFQAGLNRAKVAADGFQRALAGLGVATTVGGVLAFVGNQIRELDDASAAVRTLGVDSDDLSKRLRSLSVELDNNVSQVELTKAAYDVASSGFATAADATNVLRAAALGAKGGFADINDVARALTGVLNAYGMSSKNAGLIVDQFVKTQADGVITVRQYANEIGNVASIAAASGVKLEELNAAIATATLRGVPVQQTFTGLRQAIGSIIKPTQQASELAASLGLQFNVAALQSKGLGGVLADVQAKTGGAADKVAILLGSVEAQAAVQPLLNDNLVKYNELLARQAQASGEAAKASDINSRTISGGLKQIGTGFSNLATTLDTTLTPLFAGFIKSINEVLIKLNQVSALSPAKVQARELQAGNAVQAAIGPFGGSGFFGAVEVKFGGKTYKGTAAGIREAIVQDLLKKDLAALNPQSSQGGGAQADKPQPQPPPVAGLSKFEMAQNELKVQGTLQQVQYARQLSALEGTSLLQLQNKLAIEEKLRAAKAAQLAVEQELARPSNQPGALDKLRNTERQANLEVTLAYEQAGASLFKNAKSAADALRSSQESLQSTLRGGFDLLSPGLQQEQIARARASIQPLVDRGVIRTGIDISSPDKLFQVAQFAESFSRAEQDLGKALIENTAAQKALAEKNWQVNVAVPGGSASGDVVSAVNSQL
jgi:TP901 family phage tail tape measure protein